MKTNRWLSIIALIFSLFAIALVAYGYEFNITDSGVIGLGIAIMGVLATFMVGYQIYSILDLKATIERIKEEQRSIDLKNKSINKKIDYLDELAKDFQTKTDSVTVNTAILKAQHLMSEKKWSNALITCLESYYQNCHKNNISQELFDLIQQIIQLKSLFEKQNKNEGFYFDKDEYESIVRLITSREEGSNVDQISTIYKGLKFDLNEMFKELLSVISFLYVNNRNKSSNKRG